MSPLLQHGFFVIVRRVRRYRVNDIIVLQHQQFGTLIKRILKCDCDKVLLSGENTASINPEKMGWQPLKQVVGKVVWHSKN